MFAFNHANTAKVLIEAGAQLDQADTKVLCSAVLISASHIHHACLLRLMVMTGKENSADAGSGEGQLRGGEAVGGCRG
jgi:hypothetical protein